MSYTFSRRDFMKYTALAAAAVAVSGSLTGCSNPNRPVGTIGSTLKPGDGICEATLLSSNSKPTYNLTDKRFVCNFKLQINKNHFQVNVTTGDQTKIYYYGNSNIELNPNPLNDYEAKTSVKPTLTVDIADLATADKIEVVYIPKLWAKDSLTDSYSDIYGTWDITEAIKGSH